MCTVQWSLLNGNYISRVHTWEINSRSSNISALGQSHTNALVLCVRVLCRKSAVLSDLDFLGVNGPQP